jgi:hypothetical protein
VVMDRHVLVEKLWSSSRSNKLNTERGLATWRLDEDGSARVLREHGIPRLMQDPHEYGDSSHCDWILAGDILPKIISERIP